MTGPTQTVERSYPTGNGWRAVVGGVAYPTDGPLSQGAAVRIIDGKAVKS